MDGFVSVEEIKLIVESCRLSWWPSLASAVAILLSAGVASVLAVKNINSNRSIARQRCTMDFIMDRSRDRQFSDSFKVVREIDKDNHIDIRFYAQRNNFEARLKIAVDDTEKQIIIDEREKHDVGVKCLNYLLNQYEYMAVGIKKGIYDEDMLIDASRSSTVKAYEVTGAFITAVREEFNNPKAYTEFSNLTDKWGAI